MSDSSLRAPYTFLAATLVAGATLALSACGTSHPATTASVASKPTQPARPASASTAPNDPATIILPSGVQASHTILASVAGQPITAAEVRTLMARKTPSAPLPDPPQYSACSARLKQEAASEASPEAKALRGKGESQLREVCRGHYEEALRAALATAIHTRWLLGESRKDSIHVSERAVQEEFLASRKSFRSSGEFESYLKSSGQSVSLMKYEIKLGKLTDGLFNEAKRNDHPATPAEVAAFYQQHKQGFTIPEGRHVLIVRTATEASARRALGELRSGKSFAAVANELSAIAQPITAKRGEVKDLKPHVYEEKPLNDAIFQAKANRLYGPLKVNATHRTIASETNSGFFIFEVKGIVAARQVPLSQVKATIAQQLTIQQKEQHLAAFVIAFRRRWTAQTDCRPGYVLVKSCKQFKQPKAALTEDPYTL